MSDSITPPEGQLSFSGIPSAEFIEDVDSHMVNEESAESQLKVWAQSGFFKSTFEGFDITKTIDNLLHIYYS